jgi:enterochelin esterase family protein
VYGADVPISIYVPPCYRAADAGLPVVYLLHGGNADETQWPDVGVQAAADALIAQGSSPFIVVMPGGDYSAKLDYGAFVLSDLLPAMQQQFHTAPTRSARAIGGISLGGYWALSLALAHPEVFAAVGGHSPVVRLGRATDPLAQAQTAQGLDQLRMSLDVGDADALRADISRMVQVLQARGVAVDFGVFQGRHDRSYWRSRTPAYLRFYVDAFDAAAHASATATPTAAPSTHPGAACSTDRAHP